MSDKRHFKLRLYVAGDLPNSIKARTNLERFCQNHLPGRHEIECVDVFENSQRALEDKVFMTPTLVVLEPPPSRQIVGDLSEPEQVLRTLGLSDLNA